MEIKASNTHSFLDSLVVRISACHMEGSGLIPGWGRNFFRKNHTLGTRRSLTLKLLLGCYDND